MTIFLSCEAQSGGADLLMRFHKTTQPYLDMLKDRDYGPELTSIAIISILVRPELLMEGGYSERSLFQRKSCSADLRQHLDFNRFLSATPQQRCEIYREHILNSIELLRRKVSKAYRFDDLIMDVRQILYTEALTQQLMALKRFP